MIYCITGQQTVARVDPDGSNGRTLFTGTQELRFLNCDGHMLYFVHGDEIVELNGNSAEYRVLLKMEHMTDMYHWEDGNLYITVSLDSGESHYVYSIAGDQLTQTD